MNMKSNIQSRICAVSTVIIASTGFSSAYAEDFNVTCNGITEVQSWLCGKPEFRQEAKTYRIVDGAVFGNYNCTWKNEHGSFCTSSVSAPKEMYPTIRIAFSYNVDRLGGRIEESIYQYFSVEGIIQSTPSLQNNFSLINAIQSRADKNGEVMSTQTFKGECKKADKPKF